MNKRKKEQFCALAAIFLAPPDEQMMKMIEKMGQGGFHSLNEEDLRKWGADPAFLVEFSPSRSPEDFLPVLQAEYERLFACWQGKKISLVESTYKPWTNDSSCPLTFAATKGFIMGDWAFHMREMFHQLGLEVPDEFLSTPDHLVLELEFLSLLYRSANREQIQKFIDDHLDWLGDLKDRVDRAQPHPFYRKVIELIHLFLVHERKERNQKHGPKNFPGVHPCRDGGGGNFPARQLQ